MSKKSGLTKRQKTIIEMLAQFTADNPITIHDISERLNLSSRTILRELPAIDTWFEENDFQLVRKTRVGIYVDEDKETREFLCDLVRMDKDNTIYSKKERKEIIKAELLAAKGPLKYFYFTSLLSVSDGTLNNDLNEIEQWMSQYNLSLNRQSGIGIYWSGKEEDYRQAVVVLIRKKLPKNRLQCLLDSDDTLYQELFEHLSVERVNQVRHIINETQKVLDIQYTEHSRLHIGLYLLITIERVEAGCYVTEEEKDFLSMVHLPEYQVANWIGSKIEQATDLPIPQGEIYAVTMQLLSAKIWKSKNDRKYEEENFKTRQIVIRIIVNMEQLLHVNFLEDESLIESLYNHMRPAMNRIRLNVFPENAHLNIIKDSYPAIYEATKEACEFLKQELNIDMIQEGEIGFIAMYFGVAMEKHKHEVEKYNVCIACPHGVGTSHMLSVHLQREFPEINIKKILSTTKLQEVELREEEIDLIISTAKVETEYPCVYVNSMLLGTDIVMVRNALMKLERREQKDEQLEQKQERVTKADIQYVVTLGEEIIQVLDNIKISTEDTAVNTNMLIAYAGNLFARNEEMAEKITIELKRREEISTTYLPEKNILFLHCETRELKHCRLGYIYLKEPIVTDEIVIKGSIVMLVPKGKEETVYREVMSEISGILAERDRIFTDFHEKNRSAVLGQLELGLGKHYSKVLKRKGEDGI